MSEPSANTAHRDEAASAVPPTLSAVIGALIDHIETLREDGVRAVEMDRAVLRDLARAPAAPPAAPALPLAAVGGASPAAAPWTPPTAEEIETARRRLQEIAAEIAECRRCPLHRTRTKTVPGQGNPRPEILFVGEGPGQDEDRQGLAFVGRAGALLTRMIVAMGLDREQVFIANVVKCRATENYEMIKDRPPTLDEMRACLPYLRAQIAVLRPRVIVTLGNAALEGLTGLKGITRLRGQWREYEGVPLMPTYHPSFLLRGGGDDTARYWEVWDDLCAVLRFLGREPPSRRKPSPRA